MVNSVMSGISGVSSNLQQQQQPLLLGVDAASYLGSSHESLGQQQQQQVSGDNGNLENMPDIHYLSLLQFQPEQRDMHALKRELSLDLQPLQQPRRGATLPVKELLQAASSPNNSNFTDNTSQSVTPSEFGYQHLQRHLSMHSLLATEESSPLYEDFEQTPSNALSPAKNLPAASISSPIKSTISITYKSPEKEKPPTKPALLLETNFDENIVYEQVKLFRNSVTEVNQMLNERHGQSLKQIEEEDGSAQMAQQLLQLQKEQEEEDEDEEQRDQEQLLYENIELRKPKTVYENLRGEEMKLNVASDDVLELETDLDLNLESVAKHQPSCDRIELDSLDSLPSVEHNMEHEKQEQLEQSEQLPPSKSPSFSVKELATKFESSPVEQLPNFDFSQRGGSMKKPNNNELSLPPVAVPPKPLLMPVPLKKRNANAQKITRSLDENAFVREFGGKQLQDLTACNQQQVQQQQQQSQQQSQQQLPMSELDNRRKSFDFTRPKTLNPPKRLPGMSITEEICQKRNNESVDQLITTPTTENRISLIQQNNVPLNPPASNGRKSVLTGVILDRERIDKIKEERRQQLTQKYYGDSIKSRSKTELNSADDNNFPASESLRVKSKSRGDMHSLQKDMDMNLKQLARAGAGSESTLHQQIDYSTQHRVRSISDEKNQNCDTNTSTTNSSGSANNTNGGAANQSNSVKSVAQKYAQNNAPVITAITTSTMPGKFERGIGNRERLSRNSMPHPIASTESNASVK